MVSSGTILLPPNLSSWPMVKWTLNWFITAAHRFLLPFSVINVVKVDWLTLFCCLFLLQMLLGQTGE
jgi:hypothetical protein